ncbi:hypothetical protein E2K93_06370 [Thalassotalea sp. HSM 43]|uniref:hypothetical protein n=1 Tax=Thalassotalea sp. HSM 43 TaxID=2552945 RepID=UPI001081023F|nr:hypothetical protein [Thalassotalea sp. HSM 43]QBY04029.1 hypothetical protein E2K93_06370 [Thalassotalea sp. HSM 43]
MNNNKKSISIALVICVFVWGCATKVSSIKKDQVTGLKQNDGYFLLAVDTNQKIEEIVISGPTSIALGQADLQRGNNYILLALPEGEYSLSKVQFSKYAKRNDFDNELWSFAVKKNTISYVGHLNMEVYLFFGAAYSQLKLLNNSSIALEYMEKNFADVIDNKAMIYTGPGEDKFFDVVRPQTNQQQGE